MLFVASVIPNRQQNIFGNVVRSEILPVERLEAIVAARELAVGIGELAPQLCDWPA